MMGFKRQVWKVGLQIILSYHDHVNPSNGEKTLSKWHHQRLQLLPELSFFYVLKTVGLGRELNKEPWLYA